MQNNPQQLMQELIDLAQGDKKILQTLGRFAGQLYGAEINDFTEALGKVALEFQGNLTNMHALVTRGNAYAN
jgi:hypothetical protein